MMSTAGKEGKGFVGGVAGFGRREEGRSEGNREVKVVGRMLMTGDSKERGE